MLEHEYDVGDKAPIKERHNPVSPAIENLLYQEIDMMLMLGIIESEYQTESGGYVLISEK